MRARYVTVQVDGRFVPLDVDPDGTIDEHGVWRKKRIRWDDVRETRHYDETMGEPFFLERHVTNAGAWWTVRWL